METLKTYFNAFSETVQQHALGIIISAIIINLFAKFSIGFLFAVALVSFIIHSIYVRFVK